MLVHQVQKESQRLPSGALQPRVVVQVLLRGVPEDRGVAELGTQDVPGHNRHLHLSHATHLPYHGDYMRLYRTVDEIKLYIILYIVMIKGHSDLQELDFT